MYGKKKEINRFRLHLHPAGCHKKPDMAWSIDIGARGMAKQQGHQAHEWQEGMQEGMARISKIDDFGRRLKKNKR